MVVNHRETVSWMFKKGRGVLQVLMFHLFIALPDHLRQRLVPDSFN